MPLMTLGKCWRDRDDCEAFDSIEATPDNLTEQQMMDLSYTPKSFICCGCIKAEARRLPQDAYRLCFKNDAVDEMSDNDEQDLAHVASVIMRAVSVITTRRMETGKTLVPSALYANMVEVDTEQGK